MIKREETAVLIIASRLLSYPDETFPAYESAMDELTAEEVQSKDLKQQLKKAIELFSSFLDRNGVKRMWQLLI